MRQLSFLHHRAERRRRGGARRASGQACRPLSKQKSDARRHRIRGHRRTRQGRFPRRGTGQQIPLPYPRSGRHRARRALFRGCEHHARGKFHRSRTGYRNHQFGTHPFGYGGGAEQARKDQEQRPRRRGQKSRGRIRFPRKAVRASRSGKTRPHLCRRRCGRRVYAQSFSPHSQTRHLRRQYQRERYGQGGKLPPLRRQSEGICGEGRERGARHLRQDGRRAFADGRRGQSGVYGRVRAWGKRS